MSENISKYGKIQKVENTNLLVRDVQQTLPITNIKSQQFLKIAYN